MTIESKTAQMTAEELLHFRGDPGKRYELVSGELIEMSPPGGEHGEVTFEVGGVIRDFVRPRHLGTLYAAETGFLLRRSPDLVRAPDVAFVTRGRLSGGRSPAGYIPLAPDFVVEVVSPNDTAAEVETRINDWLRAGTQVAWAVFPDSRTVLISRGLGQVERKFGDDDLDAEPVLPGFRCKIRDLFLEE